MNQASLKIIECPRDAMQGIKAFISTDKKIKYINALLKVGFDTIDVGSFVSPSIIPQMADTIEVLSKIDYKNSSTKLLTIVPNIRGGRQAALFDQVQYIGYPFSISEKFQLNNTNKTINESLAIVDQLYNLCARTRKELVVYISMGFGNPYGDAYNPDIVYKWVDTLANIGIKTISLSDTIGIATPSLITDLFHQLVPSYTAIEFGAHLHSAAHNWEEKIKAADEAGCRRFDGAIKGYGGCPMAKDNMIGNIPTENLITYFGPSRLGEHFQMSDFQKAFQLAGDTFPDTEHHIES